MLVLRVALVAYLNVLEGCAWLNLVVVGLLHGYGDLLGMLLVWLLDAIVVHVDAKVLALPVCVDHQLDGRHRLLLLVLTLGLGRTGSLVLELFFGGILGVQGLRAYRHW